MGYADDQYSVALQGWSEAEVQSIAIGLESDDWTRFHQAVQGASEAVGCGEVSGSKALSNVCGPAEVVTRADTASALESPKWGPWPSAVQKAPGS